MGLSLLSILYKLFERLILNRIKPLVEDKLPIEQAGLRANRGCNDQVTALTSFIENGFQRGQKTMAVFVDLTAAYDTIWRKGLLLKFLKMIPCKRFAYLINDMLNNCFFKIYLNNEGCKWKRLNNGLPQGSILVSILFTFTSVTCLRQSRLC